MTDGANRLEGMTASGPGITTVEFGPIWDRMVNLITEHKRLHPVPKLIIGRGKWHAVLQRASDDDRAILEFMQQDGQIIVTDFLPDPETAYVLALPADAFPPMPTPPHPWQEYNAHGNTCQYPGCDKSEEEHAAWTR